jgi:hypothetical protein
LASHGLCVTTFTRQDEASLKEPRNSNHPSHQSTLLQKLFSQQIHIKMFGGKSILVPMR